MKSEREAGHTLSTHPPYDEQAAEQLAPAVTGPVQKDGAAGGGGGSTLTWLKIEPGQVKL